MLARILGNPWALLLGAVLAFGGGWQVRGWYQAEKDLAVIAAEQKTRDLLADLATDVAAATETAIQGIRIENRNIYTTAQKEVVKEPVYLDCVLPATGVLRANQARAAGATTGQPDRAVSGARAAEP